jgi:hypothetical protein
MSERPLVCILAETRAHELTWDNFKRNVLDELSADLALCIGVDDNYDKSNPFYRHAAYHWTISEFADYGDAFDLASRELGTRKNWRRLLAVQDQWLGGIKGKRAHPGSAAILIFYRWLLLQKLVSEGVLAKYDRVIVTRSDFFYWCPHPPLDVLDAQYVWIPYGEDYGGLTDRHLVASSRDLPGCLDLLGDILCRPRELYREMSRFTGWNLERYIHLQFRRRGLLGRVRRFPYVMTAVRGEHDKSRWSWGQLDPTVGMIIKYPTELRAASKFRDQIKSRTDWHAFYAATRFQNLQDISPQIPFSNSPRRSFARRAAGKISRILTGA